MCVWMYFHPCLWHSEKSGLGIYAKSVKSDLGGRMRPLWREWKPAKSYCQGVLQTFFWSFLKEALDYFMPLHSHVWEVQWTISVDKMWQEKCFNLCIGHGTKKLRFTVNRAENDDNNRDDIDEPSVLRTPVNLQNRQQDDQTHRHSTPKSAGHSKSVRQRLLLSEVGYETTEIVQLSWCDYFCLW